MAIKAIICTVPRGLDLHFWAQVLMMQCVQGSTLLPQKTEGIQRSCEGHALFP